MTTQFVVRFLPYKKTHPKIMTILHFLWVANKKIIVQMDCRTLFCLRNLSVKKPIIWGQEKFIKTPIRSAFGSCGSAGRYVD